MLSRKEKNELKKQIGELLKRLGEDVSRKEKNDAKREIGSLMKRLGETGAASEPESGIITNPDLEKLIAGEFDDLSDDDFINKITEISDAMGGDIEPLKEPMIRYIEKRLETA